MAKSIIRKASKQRPTSPMKAIALSELSKLDDNPRRLLFDIASGVSYFMERLADKSLLDNALVVHLQYNVCELAVPTGGRRRGGAACVSFREEAKELQLALRGVAGFADPRIVPQRGIGPYWIEWGEPMELHVRYWHDYVAHVRIGQHFGYSDVAINQFISKVKSDPHD